MDETMILDSNTMIRKEDCLIVKSDEVEHREIKIPIGDLFAGEKHDRE